MTDLLQAIASRDFTSQLPRCGYHLRRAKDLGWVEQGELDPVRLTAAGKERFRRGLS